MVCLGLPGQSQMLIQLKVGVGDHHKLKLNSTLSILPKEVLFFKLLKFVGIRRVKELSARFTPQVVGQSTDQQTEI